MAFLTLTNVSKDYGANRVVHNINLDVKKGEFISLLGPSGCGKTTTLQMIAGFVPVTEGSIHLDGQEITHVKPNQRGLGVVFQSYALFPHMTVFQNVSFGLEMKKVSKAQRHEKVQEVLDLVELSAFSKRYPRELSGGQRQRVALARALVINPALLLLDEPLSNLDAKLRESMQFELHRIQQQLGTTTLMVTHDQSEALSVSDRVVVMSEGRTIQVAQPYDLYEQPKTNFISDFVGKSNHFEAYLESESNSYFVRLADVKCQVMPQAELTPKTKEKVCLSLRPEKILLTSPQTGRLQGVIQVSFFLGTHWLHEIKTTIGTVTVLITNDGTRHYQKNEEVGLDWADQSLRVLTA